MHVVLIIVTLFTLFVFGAIRVPFQRQYPKRVIQQA